MQTTTVSVPGVGTLSVGDKLLDNREGRPPNVVAVVVSLEQRDGFILANVQDEAKKFGIKGWPVTLNMAACYHWPGKNMQPDEYVHPCHACAPTAAPKVAKKRAPAKKAKKCKKGAA